MKVWLVVGIALIQGVLLAAHWFLYRTWIDFWGSPGPMAALALRTALMLLACSFIAAALLGFYFSNWLVRLLYRVASVWLGLLNFFFWAACLCWLTGGAMALVGWRAEKPLLACVFFTLALATGLYGLLNARLIRIRRIPVQIPGLPASWRGRTALVVSDLHLGHMNGRGFSRRVVRLAARLKPEIVFIPGDLFDGGKADAGALAEPFKNLAPPFGIYFSTGNHDEFGDAAHYAEVLGRTGIRVLANERVTVDGLHILGVNYGDSGDPVGLRGTLERLRPAPGQASILLHHAPSGLELAEQTGIGLQISGHTHGGQLFPFTWLTRRVFGKFTYGLQRYGALQVYTSSGAGTWGPPMRVGTCPEIILIRFD